MVERISSAGGAWLEVVSRPSLLTFAEAFTACPLLEAAVLSTRIVGVDAIYQFFQITRAMYDRIAFVHETRGDGRACLEWEGQFNGKDIGGATILTYDMDGLIERIRLFHFPFEQLNAFAADLVRRRALDTNLNNVFPGVNYENER